jgi:hypothetical protein
MRTFQEFMEATVNPADWQGDRKRYAAGLSRAPKLNLSNPEPEKQITLDPAKLDPQVDKQIQDEVFKFYTNLNNNFNQQQASQEQFIKFFNAKRNYYDQQYGMGVGDILIRQFEMAIRQHNKSVT